MGIAGDGVEHGAIGFDAERKRVVADQLARRGEIFLAEEERRWNLLRQLLLGEGFGADEAVIEFGGEPGILCGERRRE